MLKTARDMPATGDTGTEDKKDKINKHIEEMGEKEEGMVYTL